MARSLSLSQTLIRFRTTTTTTTTTAPPPYYSSHRSTNFSISFRTHSTHSDSSCSTSISDSGDAEALAVRRIEDAIHRIIVKKSAPDWLPFVPGASYWVPPKRRNYGIAQIVHNIANSLTDEQVMSLTTSRGWPSSAFYIYDASSEQTEVMEASGSSSLSEDEEG